MPSTTVLVCQRRIDAARAAEDQRDALLDRGNPPRVVAFFHE